MSTQPLTSVRLEFDEAIDVIEAYYERGWTDGLPIVPPTVGRVRQFVEYVGRSPSEIVGAEPTKGRVITLEKVAINAVMAGCLPEHFPVVLAAIEAISEPKFNLHAMTVSTMGAAVLVVVNGPIAREYRPQLRRERFRPRTPRQRRHWTRHQAGHHKRHRLGFGRAGQGDAGPRGQVHLVHSRGGGREPVGAAARG